MGKKSPKAPAPPDPVVTAQAQSEANIETARAQQRMNFTNQVTPFGSLTYTNSFNGPSFDEYFASMQAQREADPNYLAQREAGGARWNELNMNDFKKQVQDQYDARYPNQDQWTVTQTLSPSEQRQLDLSNAAQETYGRAALSQLQQVEGQMSKPFAPNLPGFSSPGFDGEAYLRANPDVAAAGMDPLQHYLQFGRGEGRAAPEAVRDRTANLTAGVQDRAQWLTTNIGTRTPNLAYEVDTSRFGQADMSREAVENALLERMRPQQERERAALETRLANQGISAGSAAWQTAMDDYNRSTNDARLGAVLRAGEEQSRVYGLGLTDAQFRNDAQYRAQTMDLERGAFYNGALNQQQEMDIARGVFGNQAAGQAASMDLARAQFGNQARQQSLQEQLALRNQPINEAAALLSGQQVQMPSFVNAPQAQIGGTNVLGSYQLSSQAEQNAYNAAMQSQSADRSGIASMAGTAALGTAIII